MDKRKLLLITPPGEFITNEKYNFKFQAISLSVVVEEIDDEKFEIDYYDYDAHFIKEHRTLADYLKSGLTIDSLIDAMIPDVKYDYILITIPLLKNAILQLILVTYYTTLILKKFPETKIICGGYGLPVYSLIDLENVEHSLWGEDTRGSIPGVEYEHYEHIVGQLQWPIIKNLEHPNISLYQTLSKYHLDLDVWDDINKDRSNGELSIHKPARTEENYNDNCPEDEEKEVICYGRITPVMTKITDNVLDYRYHYPEIHPDLNYPDRFIQQAAVKFSTGCANKCFYCSHSTEKLKRLPFKDIPRIIESYLEAGFNSFFMLDASANYFAEKLCNWISKNNIKMSWSNDFNLSNTSADFWQMLSESGCHIVEVSTEIVDDWMLDYINKRTNVKKLEQGLQYAHDAGLWINNNYIFGLPYETKEAMLNTIKFIEEKRDIVNSTAITMFRFKPHSEIGFYPEKYNVEILNRHGYKIRHGERRYFEYLETDPNRRMFDTYAEKVEFQYQFHNFVIDYLKDKKIPLWPHPSQHLIFALFDIFGSKEKVVSWLNENYYE